MQKDKKASNKARSPMIPAIRTVIYQPNAIVHAQYHYTLIQERIFNYVMFYLQHHIKRIMNGESITQLEIFNTQNDDIRIIVPMAYIVPDSPSQYREVRRSAESLATVIVKVPYKHPTTGRDWHCITGLLSVHVPAPSIGQGDLLTKKRSNNIIISIRRNVAEMLVNIDKKQNGQPQNFTSFLFEVTMTAKNKYTSRIYKFISSWKNRGVKEVKLQDFKAMLGIENSYSSYADFKNKILIPVQEELMQKADCWFDCEVEGFEVRANSQVEALNFKISSEERNLTECKLWNNIWHLLKTHFRISDTQCDQLRPGFKKHQPEDVTYKIIDLNQRLHSQSSDIQNPNAYVMKVLLKDFA